MIWPEWQSLTTSLQLVKVISVDTHLLHIWFWILKPRFIYYIVGR